jgi:carotenoid cleavage dioxygenase
MSASEAIDDVSATKPKWHVRGNWAPVHDELSTGELPVDGAIPPELDGCFLRTGPNPAHKPGPHWFFGDGMVHGVRLSGGKAQWYRNRQIQTLQVTEPLANRDDGLGDLRRGTGNTHVVVHNDKILCLEEAHWPWRLDGGLNTVGYENFGGALDCAMTAHPKVCPETGELLAFSYFQFEAPHLRYIRIGADGTVAQIEPIDIPNLVMMHDFAITRNHTVFMDLPLVFDLEQLPSGIPFSFKPDAGARLGVLPRNGTNADVRWFEIDPCYVFHTVNAHESEDGRTITLDASRMPGAFVGSSDEYGNVGRLHRWTIDLETGGVTDQQIDDRPGDFGRVDDRAVGTRARYGYLMSLGGEGNTEEPVYGSELLKYDLETGRCWEHKLGDGVRGGEPIFVPAGQDAVDDEGWVLTIAHDEGSGRSRLVVVDAKRFDGPPIATVELPQRVPYGAHGSWIDGTLLAD